MTWISFALCFCQLLPFVQLPKALGAMCIACMWAVAIVLTACVLHVGVRDAMDNGYEPRRHMRRMWDYCRRIGYKVLGMLGVVQRGGAPPTWGGLFPHWGGGGGGVDIGGVPGGGNFFGFGGGGGNGGGVPGAGGNFFGFGGGGNGNGGSRAERTKQISETIRGLRVEAFEAEEDLRQRPVGELKGMLRRRGIDPERCGCVMKSELVAKLRERWGGGSSAQECAICLEVYETGDAVRVLPCNHRFHLECVDKWALSAVDFSRAISCPICNAPIQEATTTSR